jgi:hypothetical protein
VVCDGRAQGAEPCGSSTRWNLNPGRLLRRCRRGATTAAGGLRTTFSDPYRHRPTGVRCSTGSGITADATRLQASGANNKRAFVRRASQPFELLEQRWRLGRPLPPAPTPGSPGPQRRISVRENGAAAQC